MGGWRQWRTRRMLWEKVKLLRNPIQIVFMVAEDFSMGADKPQDTENSSVVG
jgi:hypothetical protein